MTQKTLRNPLMPILYVLRLTGFMPFSVDHLGHLRWSWLSLPVLWASLALSSHLFSLGYFLHLNPSLLDWKNAGVGAVLKLGPFIHIFMLVQPILATWTCMGDIVRAVNRWNLCQNLVAFKTRRHPVSKVAQCSEAGVVVGFVFAGILTLPKLNASTNSLDTKVDMTIYLGKVVYFFNTSNFFILAWYWTVLGSMVESTFNVVRQDLIQVLSRNPHPKMVQDCRFLWLDLHSSTLGVTQSLSKTMGVWLIEIITFLSLLLFGAVTFKSSSVRNIPILFLVPYLANRVLPIVCIFAVFVAGHAAQEKVNKTVNSLLSCKWTNLSEESIQEMDIFMNAVEMCKPCFDIAGVFLLNKTTFISMMTTVTTYVIVLLEFGHPG